ncbi:hypothetical protein HYG86_00475 [Alkalicella caledoniensis]|uniref:rRNA biogenesis protein rrp5 n=1 Tax=Alkalicella caledoniensis TaxID=2731377 RepID=A0A7G9W3U2_ALKCA|nr:hypothetical protein [Alkalicella caledoniensis]QNO13354.1 hypothetical protein HYG86_00475 [Alkalicella caledoniensis]
MSRIKLALEVVENMRSLASSIEDLVQAIEGSAATTQTDVKETPIQTEDKTEVVQETKEENQPKEKTPSLEEVRALMAAKNREGHREAVKAILNKYGAQKLTALDSSHYKKVMEEVGDLK